ncbi:ABC transporter ATP-binding protein [Marinomonas piezotolerans]|uniref:ABC transporter ATP-binding protein n=1 Tax=Marinomonas piezotolerans TaxID=2213058 RepID=A0A370UBC1_9GAMM|nr:ABC transporter ATP-binding protein [Marinomonas piezotolerans]RDL45084.1 ABC transporter ATP-binding protein [Marinomonas piezotolerans]
MLSVRNLDVRYGQFRAVQDVSMEIAQGDIVSLIGANGAGKSTLLRAIAGALPVYSGSVSFKQQDVTQTPSSTRVKQGLSLVPEGRRLFADMTVEENLLLGTTVKRSGDWNIDRIFETFPNLVKRRHSKTGHLSGGEQQATAIGRALMSNPDLLILDEVSLGLSPLVVDQVYASINSLKGAGTTILLVEQDLGRAISFSQRAICMLEGKVVLDKPTCDTNKEEITQAYFGLHQSNNQEAS